MSTLGKRLTKAREAKGLSQTQLAKLVGITQQSLQAIEAGETKQPRRLDKIAEFLNVDPAWLQFGTGDSPFAEMGKNRTIQCDLISLISWHDAAYFLGNDLSIVPLQLIPYPTGHSPGAGKLKLYALKVENDSMVSPHVHVRSFRPGEIIIIEPERTPLSGNFVIAYRENSPEAMLKQYIVDAGQEFLMALNPQYPSIKIDDTIKIIGVVIAKHDQLITP